MTRMPKLDKPAHLTITTSAAPGGSRMLQLPPARRSIAAPIDSNPASMQAYSFSCTCARNGVGPPLVRYTECRSVQLKRGGRCHLLQQTVPNRLSTRRDILEATHIEPYRFGDRRRYVQRPNTRSAARPGENVCRAAWAVIYFVVDVPPRNVFGHD